MRVEEEAKQAAMRRAIVAVADAARTVARTRSAIARASDLVGMTASFVADSRAASGSRSDAARALGELELAGREAGRVAADITSAGFGLANAAGRTPELTRLLPPPNVAAPRAAHTGDLLRRAAEATTTSALLAEETRDAVARAELLVRDAAGRVEPGDWPRRIRVDAALVDVWAAARGAGALADGTASARRWVGAARPGAPVLRVEQGGAGG